MSETLFAVRPGFAVSVPMPVAAPLTIGMTGWGNISSGGGFAAQKSIITGLQLRENVNAQLQQTLGEVLYATTFGDGPGDLTISGVSVAGSCDFDGPSGFDAVHRFYHQFKFSKMLRPIGIAIGGTAFRALLLDRTTTIDNPEAGLSGFSLHLATIPDKL